VEYTTSVLVLIGVRPHWICGAVPGFNNVLVVVSTGTTIWGLAALAGGPPPAPPAGFAGIGLLGQSCAVADDLGAAVFVSPLHAAADNTIAATIAMTARV